MKKINMTTLVLASIFALSIASPAYATNVNFGADLKTKIEQKDDRQQDRNNNKDDHREATKPGLLSRLFNRNRVAIGNGKVNAKSDTTLTVEKDGTIYTVNIDNKTKFIRRYWGVSSLSEVSVGNMVNIIGSWTDDAHTSVLARQVRDLSIQKRAYYLMGIVKSLTSNGWIMSSLNGNKADQTVTVSSSTKFTNRKEETIAQGDVQVGARVRVHGSWDLSSNTVAEVKSVKDFSLPVKVTATPTVAPTATP